MAVDEVFAVMADEEPGKTNSLFLRDLRRQRSPIWILAALLPVLLPLLLLVGTGLYGLDFGKHWDEEFMLGKVKRSIDSGILLPENFYNYPSMTYWLSFIGSGLEIIPAVQNADAGAELGQIMDGESFGIRSQWSARILSHANLLKVRGLFLIVSALAVVWVYLLQLVWRRSWIEALLAASILALSWQVAYHLRWISPDAVLMQFVALTTLLVMLVRLRPDHDRTWLRLAAVAAGLACGTKYQAGLILVPVLIAAFQSWDRDSFLRGLLPLFLEILLIFGFSYLITTPGTVLAPIEFARDVFYEAQHYQSGHIGSTVTAGFEHLKLNFNFFSLSLFSRYELISVVFFIFSVAGIFALIFESRALALLFLSFPVVYVLMISLQRVMFLRNLLVLAPFFAILSARGITLAWERSSNKYVRISLAAVVTVLLLVNAGWLIYAADTIFNGSPERFALEAAAYIEKHPESRFYVSDKVWNDLDVLEKGQATNITRDHLDSADMALFYLLEGRERIFGWPATRRDLTITWFGPWEVDFNYYSAWVGADRILLMPMDTARELGVSMVK